MKLSELLTESELLEINWRKGLATAALAGTAALSNPAHAEYTPKYHQLPQLTQQQFEQELAKADAEYEKTGSSQPYRNLQQKLVDTWDMKDTGYYQLISQVMDHAKKAKREHPTRNGTLGQIYHGERSLIPHM